MSLQELIAQRDALAQQKAALDKAIADAQSETRKGVTAQIKMLMAEHGITAEDLVEIKKVGKPKAAVSGEPGGRGKVAAKYKDDAGNAWSGRGLKPKWLSAALAAGRTLEEFAV